MLPQRFFKQDWFIIRYRLILTLGLLFILLLVFRLFQLQIWLGKEYQARSENNRVKLIKTGAARGIIFDQHGKPLATNRRVFSVFVDTSGVDVKLIQNSIFRLAKILKIHPDAIFSQILTSKHQLTRKPQKVAEDVDFPTITAIREQAIDLPGVYVKDEFRRFYVEHNVAAHVLGYLGKMSDEELSALEYETYEGDEYVGKMGLEKVYEPILHGTSGGWAIEVDVYGNKRRELGNVESIAGNSLVLNLDLNLQKKANELLTDKKGTIIAMDPNTGAILAMVSKPDFDPNQLSGIVPEHVWNKIRFDPDSPLQNRGIKGLYPPGSIFKIITALAALEKKVIEPTTVINCPGKMYLGNWEFKCWKKEGHHAINLLSAITYSCNVYFYQIALRTDIEPLEQLAYAFGLGMPTGIDLPGEQKGLVPSRAVKKKMLKQGWYPGDTAQTGIGQGLLWVTPLQMLNVVCCVANGGTVYKPYIVRTIETNDGKVIRQFSPQKIRQLEVSPEHIKVIQKGMWGVVNAPGGTGALARLPKIELAGKTGTAQNPHGKTHAWFCGYGPFEKPEIAIIVLVEEGGFGGTTAAPLAKQLFEAYFNTELESKTRT
ncbi:MAG: penicillin-binding protein 2 [bacterium]|nr:penicillin-binding protein 2 [bacterium]